jgi:hypothetical protein
MSLEKSLANFLFMNDNNGWIVPFVVMKKETTW